MAQKWSKFLKAFIDNEGYKRVLIGLKSTLEIAFFGFIIGLVIGMIIATVQIASSKSKNKCLKVFSEISKLYVGFFRGTPIIVQLLLFYYVFLPTLGITVNKLIVAIITFGFNSGAYVSEIMRAGILSIDNGQMEAGRSLGLGFSKTMIKIVLPQAFKNMVPTLGNELIALVKDTSVASFISVVDLTNAFQLLGASSYEYIVPYLVLAAVYLVIVITLSSIIKFIEKKLRAGDKK